MRREQHFRMDHHAALEMLGGAPYVHLAAVDENGAPILRIVHVVLIDGAACFHGAPAGEKLQIVGRPAVMSVEEAVAEIPSYFTDPEKACPATTLYRSVQAHGLVERVDDMNEKARVLQRLMERFQPEGGHTPITANDPRYEAAVRGILILRVPLARVDGKAKLAQNKSPAEVAHLMTRLWQRGRREDVRAIEMMRPYGDTPEFLRGPAHMMPQLDASHADAAVEMLAGVYWNEGVPRDRIRDSLLGSTAWVGATHDGQLVANARALSDGAKWATIYDVVVREDWRGRGLGRAVVKLLLDHPAVRHAAKVTLRTRDAQPVYETLGFVERPSSQHPEMVLERRTAKTGLKTCPLTP